MKQVDPAVLSLLNAEAKDITVAPVSGGTSSARTFKLTRTQSDGSTVGYFMKTSSGTDAETMFRGEHASLSALGTAVPSLCPRSHGYGRCHDGSGTWFLVTDFLDRGAGAGGATSGPSLAQKLARLHTTPAPTPEGFDRPQFGFPVTTCCGDTPQENAYSASWAEFYAERRLRAIARRSAKSNGPDRELEQVVEETCTKVVPRLLGDDHLNNGRGITPVVVHGDLWSGNASSGRLPEMEAPEAVVFDSSACYAHSEYELGIMKMFGGFGGQFLEEYHQLVPKTEPVEEYADRVALYELFHHLNHHAMFGGGYRGGAMSIMKSLLAKYGKE